METILSGMYDSLKSTIRNHENLFQEHNKKHTINSIIKRDQPFNQSGLPHF